MRLPGRKKDDREYNYWQPATDMMAALVFVLLLVIALLVLYLLYDTPRYTREDTVSREYAADDGGTDREDDDGDDDEEDGGGGGGSQETTEEETETETEIEEETTAFAAGGGYGYGYGPGFDEGIKSAVFVELVDAETEKVIKEAGVDFELYESNGALQILNTYYPRKISYRQFATMDNGTFYLPEKIYQGSYYFHELTEPEGYDKAEDQYFDIHELYDWPEPYLVRIPVYPSKNVIRVQVNDMDTGLSVEGGSFNVIAAEDVTTTDGTLRYRKDQIVDIITINENGYGESGELYLGNYLLRQSKVPDYYAGIEEEIEAEVVKKTEVEPELHELLAEKTTIELRLTDELYPEQAVAGAAFSVEPEAGGQRETVSTDESGRLVLTDLSKDTVYRIRQLSSAGDYHFGETEITVSVAADGRIDGSAKALLSATNRLLRVEIGAVDRILGSRTANVTLSLYDEENRLIRTWTETGAGQSFTDLSVGSYYVVKDGDTGRRYEFQVRDVKEVQQWNVPALTAKGVLAAAGGVLLFAAVIIFAVLAVSRRRRRKKQA